MPTKLQQQIEQLRREIARREADLGTLRDKLAVLLRKQDPADTSAVTGLDLLWKAALPKSRERSSRRQCRIEWHKIPKSQRPPIDQLVAALRAWNKSEEWTKDHGAFAPGLHRWIKRMGWEDLPEIRDPLAVYRRPSKSSAPAPDPGDLVTDPEEVRRILGL